MEMEVKIKPDKEPAPHQLAKLVLGTAAGFIAKATVEAIYDKFVLHKTKTPTSPSE